MRDWEDHLQPAAAGPSVDEARVYTRTRQLTAARRALLDALVERRRSLNLSQSDLARRLDTTQSAISAIEQGRKDSRLWTLLRMAEALDCYIDFDLKPLVVENVTTLGDAITDSIGAAGSEAVEARGSTSATRAGLEAR